VFRQELDALQRVRHPHIVRLLGFCDQQGLCVVPLLPLLSCLCFCSSRTSSERRAEMFSGFVSICRGRRAGA
jgi:serine/threonine protein kinase